MKYIKFVFLFIFRALKTESFILPWFQRNLAIKSNRLSETKVRIHLISHTWSIAPDAFVRYSKQPQCDDSVSDSIQSVNPTDLKKFATVIVILFILDYYLASTNCVKLLGDGNPTCRFFDGF